MGRRAKRPSPETALRMRICALPAPLGTRMPEQDHSGKIRMRRTNAANEWAIKVFQPKYGYLPTQDELCAAIDSGVVGRWYESVTTPKVEKRVICVGDTEIPYEDFVRKTEKKKDYRYRDEMRALKRKQRENGWRIQAEQEVIQACIAGTAKGTAGELEAMAQKLVAKKKEQWEIDQIFLKYHD